MAFPDELREAREAAGLSREALADASGVSASAIKKYETGLATPRYDNLDALERTLGVRFNLMEDATMPTEPQVVPDLDEARSTDKPPRVKKAAGARKSAAPKGMPSLQAQLQMPYKLAAAGLRTRLPNTAQMLEVQAGPCAAAWDQFLLRYPGLRDKIEQGAVAADIVNLVMAHVPIVQVAREEMAIQAAMMDQTYDGGLGGQAA